jgi:hypothetical protein
LGFIVLNKRYQDDLALSVSSCWTTSQCSGIMV